MPKQKECMTAERFIELLGATKWKQVREMLVILDDGGYWDDDLVRENAETDFKLKHIRRMARKLKHDDGSPVFVNVKRRLKTGKEIQLYKQLYLFDVQDVRYVVRYHKGLGIHHMEQANWFAQWGNTNLSAELPLPFPSFDDAA